MTSGARIGILGGTFDPVHVGHVETALAAHRAMGLDRVLLMPSGIPPRGTSGSVEAAVRSPTLRANSSVSNPSASIFHR